MKESLPTRVDQDAKDLHDLREKVKHIFDDAIAAFRAADDAEPGYHSAHEIASLLEAERGRLNTPDGKRAILDRIAKDYSWRVAPDIVKRLSGRAPE